jgi:hypothetical protein
MPAKIGENPIAFIGFREMTYVKIAYLSISPMKKSTCYSRP